MVAVSQLSNHSGHITKTQTPSLAPSYPKRPKGKKGPVSFLEKAKLPRYAGVKTQIQAKRNENKSIYTRKVYRYGFNLMHKTCPKKCVKNTPKKTPQEIPNKMRKKCLKKCPAKNAEKSL